MIFTRETRDLETDVNVYYSSRVKDIVESLTFSIDGGWSLTASILERSEGGGKKCVQEAIGNWR